MFDYFELFFLILKNVFDFGVWIIIEENLEEVGKFKKKLFHCLSVSHLITFHFCCCYVQG